MPDVALVASPREESGPRPSRRLRVEGRIPAVLYGHGGEPTALSIDARDFRTALASQAGGGVLLDLHVGSDSHLVVTREIQRHPVRRTITHIDFQIVSRDEVIASDVPIHLVGEALAVTRADGNVDHALLSLHVRAKPADIPGSIEVDITDLEVGSTIRLGDITLPDGVSSDLDPETAIVIGQASHAAADAAAEAAEAVAEGEAPSEPAEEADSGSSEES